VAPGRMGWGMLKGDPEVKERGGRMLKGYSKIERGWGYGGWIAMHNGPQGSLLLSGGLELHNAPVTET